MFRSMLAAVVVVVLLVFGNSANAETLTGCLKTNGQLTRIAVGDDPAQPCTDNQAEVSLGATLVFVHVGFSTTEINPFVDVPGFPGMHAPCQAKFGPVARLSLCSK